MKDKQKRKAKNFNTQQTVSPLRFLLIISLLFVILFSIMMFFIQEASPSIAELTATSIVATNQYLDLQSALTATQQKIEYDMTVTNYFHISSTPTPTFTPTPTQTIDYLATQTAEASED